jgi:RNA-binding protein
VGKLGVNDSFIDGLDKAIEKRELVKITVLENSGLDVKEVGFEIAEKLNAEFVCATGRKLVFYRRSKSDKVSHIEF